MSVAATSIENVPERTLHRSIDWKDAVWIAMGVPAVVLFSIGAIAATVGTPSWSVWTISVLFGFLQAFTYAEIAGLFPNKSGGASVYGAAAWLRYGKMIAPISVWTNWFAWSPVLAIGSCLAASAILRILVPADAAIMTWQLTLLDLGMLKESLVLRINANFIIGLMIMLCVFAIQHHGILRTAKVQTIASIAVLIPLLIVGIAPWFNGAVSVDNFAPFVPIARDEAGAAIPGAWDKAGWTLIMGGLFIAAWSTYAMETTVCYTSEFKNPGTDVVKSILVSGLVCLFFFFLIPFTFQGALGLNGMLEPGIYDGSGVAAAMARIVGGGSIVVGLMTAILILAVLLSVMMAMAGSSRTLYQGSVDGWLPRYLSHVNEHGAPTRAMWTDFGFNVLLLLLSDSLFVLAVSNCCYIIFNFLNLNAGWIHRIDNADAHRPWRCPNWLLAIGTILAFANCAFLGAGANVWGPGTLTLGVLSALLILPVFWYRHYYQDGGRFPEHTFNTPAGGASVYGDRKAGILPYAALAAGAAVVLISNYIVS